MKVLLVEDQPTDAEFVNQSLRHFIPRLQLDHADSGERAMESLCRKDYDCLIIDHRLPGMSGLSLLSRLNEKRIHRRCAIIMLTGHGSEHTAASAIKLGAADYLCKADFTPQELGEAVSKAVHVRFKQAQRRRRLERLAFLATHDFLTGLGNRASFNEHFDELLARSRRSKEAFAVIALDLNCFKAINDQLGHAAGDLALQQFASRLEQAARESDHFYRIGGDEFIGLCEIGIRRETLAKLCERLELALNSTVDTRIEGLPVTASIGAALYPEDGCSLETLLATADQAMYQRKQLHKRQRGTPQAPHDQAATG